MEMDSLLQSAITKNDRCSQRVSSRHRRRTESSVLLFVLISFGQINVLVRVPHLRAVMQAKARFGATNKGMLQVKDPELAVFF